MLYCAGIWGGKGQGKSFQTELIFQVMGVEPVIMSAGELESERAGIRFLLRYFNFFFVARYVYLTYYVCIIMLEMFFFSFLFLLNIYLIHFRRTGKTDS